MRPLLSTSLGPREASLTTNYVLISDSTVIIKSVKGKEKQKECVNEITETEFAACRKVNGDKLSSLEKQFITLGSYLND